MKIFNILHLLNNLELEEAPTKKQTSDCLLHNLFITYKIKDSLCVL